MFRFLSTSLLTALFPTVLLAQGNNTGMGGDDQDSTPSLAERVLRMENKHDAFHVYLNFSSAGMADLKGDDGKTGFRCKQLRLEIKGNLTDRLYYRLRHRLNKSNAATNEDNFSNATDYMMMGYRLNDRWTIEAGKMFPYWGGFEYNTNPMYIYQYSDMVDNHDMPKAGVVVAFKPIPTQEFVVDVSNARNEQLETAFPGISAQGITDTKTPLTVILNWNGSFAHQLLQTRWSWGLRTLAKNTYSRQLTLGQKLNLPKFQCFVDYTYESDDIDRMGVISREARHLLPTGKSYFENVEYHSVVAKADWQFAPQWNAYVQVAYETASVKNGVEALHNYRKHYSYFVGVEYYPDKSQDLRFSLSYLGQSFRYTDRSGMKVYNDAQPAGGAETDRSRIELGMMFRIKCF